MVLMLSKGFGKRALWKQTEGHGMLSFGQRFKRKQVETQILKSDLAQGIMLVLEQTFLDKFWTIEH
jgi:hypothetical protein